jgi:hypothetical protein
MEMLSKHGSVEILEIELNGGASVSEYQALDSP